MQLVPFVAVVVSRQQVTRTESRQCTGTLVIKERADITCKRRNMVQAKKNLIKHRQFYTAAPIEYSARDVALETFRVYRFMPRN